MCLASDAINPQVLKQPPEFQNHRDSILSRTCTDNMYVSVPIKASTDVLEVARTKKQFPHNFHRPLRS